jgi:hypothetical protein
MYKNSGLRKIFEAEISPFNPESGKPYFKKFTIGEGIWHIILTMETQSPEEIEVEYAFGISESESVGNCSRGGLFVKSIETIQYSLFLEVKEPSVYYLYYQAQFNGFIATKLSLSAN